MTNLISVTKEYDELVRLCEIREELEKLEAQYIVDQETGTDRSNELSNVRMNLFNNWLDIKIIKDKLNKLAAA